MSHQTNRKQTTPISAGEASLEREQYHLTRHKGFIFLGGAAPCNAMNKYSPRLLEMSGNYLFPLKKTQLEEERTILDF